MTTSSLRIAVVSDLHANARALEAALHEAREAAPDRTVVLGDLLTYGLDVDRVLELVDEAHAGGASVVLGNHDQLYLDLAAGDHTYADKLPAWIRESVEHTLTRLDVAAFRARYAWRTSLRFGDVLLAHANPFAYGDWTYLNGIAELDRASDAVAAAGARVFVYGHNHRAGVHVRGAPPSQLGDGGTAHVSLDGGPVLVNAGSVGQPRSSTAVSTLAVLDVDADDLRVSLRPVVYDVAAHCDALGRAQFTESTRAKLQAFFTPHA